MGQSWKLKKTVLMVGMMGAGKTAVGRVLAAKLGAQFLDSDAEIEAAATMTIAEIFERDGEAFFRDRETEVIDRLLGAKPVILSTGGGAFLQERNRDLIVGRGVSLWLDADLELLWARVKSKDTRPLLRTDDPYATLKSIYEARVPVYALADLTVKADPAYSIDDMANAVLKTLITDGRVVEPAS